MNAAKIIDPADPEEDFAQSLCAAQLKRLTARQRKILDFISNEVRSNGMPPTLREIATIMSIRSTNGVNDHLRALERKGYIRRHDKKSRGIVILVALDDSGLALPRKRESLEHEELRARADTMRAALAVYARPEWYDYCCPGGAWPVPQDAVPGVLADRGRLARAALAKLGGRT